MYPTASEMHFLSDTVTVMDYLYICKLNMSPGTVAVGTPIALAISARIYS